MILLRYNHHSNEGLILIAIPLVIILWYMLKFLFAIIVGGLSTALANIDKILGGLGKIIKGTFSGFIALLLYLLRLIIVVLVLFVFVGTCAGILYLLGHQIAYWAEGVGLLAGMVLGFWLFSKCSHKSNEILDRIFHS